MKCLLYSLIGLTFILTHFYYCNSINSRDEPPLEFTLLDLTGNIFIKMFESMFISEISL